MGETNSISARVIRFNNTEYGNVIVMSIACSNFKVGGLFWRVPVVDLIYPGQIRYEYRNGAAAKPSTDSAKVIRVTDNNSNNTYYAVVSDSQDTSEFTSRCTACCGEDEAWPVVAVPEPFIEDKVCADDSGDVVVFTIVDGDPAAGQVLVAAASYDGTPLTPVGQTSGFATVAAFITWATTNWSTVTWANAAVTSGRKVSFTKASQTGSHTGSVSLTPAYYYDSDAVATATKLDVTANGVVYDQLAAASNAALVAAANLDPKLSLLGVFSVIAGNKVRLVSKTVTSATLDLTA